MLAVFVQAEIMPAPFRLAAERHELVRHGQIAGQSWRVAGRTGVARNAPAHAFGQIHHGDVEVALPCPMRGELVEGLPDLDLRIDLPLLAHEAEVDRKS